MNTVSGYVDIKISRSLYDELKKIAKILIKNRMGNGTLMSAITYIKKEAKV